MPLQPFRAVAGFDAHGKRGRNLAAPQQDTDFANRIWTQEEIAAQSRLRGPYIPDFDGLGTPAPDLDALTPGIDVLTADYWTVIETGQAVSGPAALKLLTAGDRLIAIVSNGGATAVTLNPATPGGLIPNWTYRFEPSDLSSASSGRDLGMLLFTNGTGTVNATAIVNPGSNYQVGDVINGELRNGYNAAISGLGAITPAAFNLDPDTTYYDVEVTGGTGALLVVALRTDATGTAIAQQRVIFPGNGYTVGDTLTFTISGQVIGTAQVTSVYSGANVPITVTIDAVGLAAGYSFARGTGLTRAEANNAYLRLDGDNSPREIISWNNQRLEDLADPINLQDAVNLRYFDQNKGGFRQQAGFGTQYPLDAWVRVGTIAAYRYVELLIRARVQGSGSGTARVAIGQAFANRATIHVFGVADLPQLKGYRLVTTGVAGEAALEVQARLANMEIDMVTVLGEEPLDFTFDPTFQVSPGGTELRTIAPQNNDQLYMETVAGNLLHVRNGATTRILASPGIELPVAQATPNQNELITSQHAQVISARIPVADVAAATGAGFRLRLFQMARASSGMFQISWVQSTNANWTGMATYSGNANGNIGVAPKLEMLSGEFGFGQVQLVEDGGTMWVEFVADAAKAYQANSFFNIWVAWGTAYDVRPTIPASLVEGTSGTVRVVIDDEVVFVQKLGDLADVDLTGVT